MNDEDSYDDEDQEYLETRVPEGMRPPRIDTATEFGIELISPSKPDVNSPYHKYVTKDMAISFFKNEKYAYMVLKYIALIEDFVFIADETTKKEVTIIDKNGKQKTVIKITPHFNAIRDMATIYDAEMKAFITALRSVGGFEREKLTTVTQVVRREPHTEAKEKRGWFR